jgi:integrase
MNVAIKRGKTWHADFFIDGIRYRQSLETTDWREAQSRERDLIKKAKEGILAARVNDLAKLTFRDAAQRFIDDRAPGRPILSVRTERQRARAICRSLGERHLKSLTPGDVLAYVGSRVDEKRAPATINRELDIIRGVLKRARRWHLFAEDVKPLRLPETIGRALTDDEKIRLLHLASSRKEWQTVYYAAVLALNTTMRSCEIKGLRWRDIDMLERVVTVRKSKSRKGVRVIPLNADAWQVITALYERAEETGGPDPDHFLFFSCEHGSIDPRCPQKGWRTAWRSLTRLISCPECGTAQQPRGICRNANCREDLRNVKSPLAGLRFHDLRHHAITELAESQASDQTVRDIAGPVSNRMLEHYSHIRLAAKHAALDALATKKSIGRGYDTKTVTTGTKPVKKETEVVENMVELVGIEPTTSSLRTMRSPS